MSKEESTGTLNELYRNRIGKPATHDEVRGYWVFLVGLLLGTLGIILFLPSESAVGTTGLTMREVSIVLSAIGLSMIIAGFVIRLPLQSWANYAAYLGQMLCFAAAIWFMMVFPADWSVQTGSQPVFILYALGIAVIAGGGVIAPLLVGVTKEDLDASEGRTRDVQAELESVRGERDALEEDLDAARDELDSVRDESEMDAVGQSEEIAQLQGELESLRTSQAQYELYQGSDEKYRWRLRHRNGNIIADSSQGYTRKHNAQKGMASVRRNALGGAVLYVEPEPDQEPDAALEDAPLLPEAVEESNASFELYEDNAGQYRWRLRHRNGNIVADSGEGYASKRAARDGIESVKRNVDPAEYLQLDPTSFEVYRDAGGKWRWRLVHKNGNVLAAASQGYTRRRDAKRSVDSIRETVADTDGFEIYQDNEGGYRWRLRAGNEEIIATSAEGYSSNSKAKDAVERVRTYGPDADALDVAFAAFEVYKDQAEEWRWRLRHRQGRILADSGQGYSRRRSAHDAIEKVKKNAPGGAIEERDD